VLSLTNLRFQNDKPDSLNVTVPWADTMIPIRISPRGSYVSRVIRLAKTEDIMPTATLRFSAPGLNANAINDFISDLCLAISIVQGKKINWIYHATYGPRRTLQHAVFGETTTKANTEQPLCFNPKMRTGVTPDLAAYKDALPKVTSFRKIYDLSNRLINAWL